MPVMITLNKIREASLDEDDWETAFKAHKHLGMDAEFPLSNILDSNDLNDVLRCFIEIPEYIEIPKRFSLWCARQVQYLVTDEHSVNALDIAERYLDGNATLEELEDAAHAADVATAAAADAICAARAAANAVYAIYNTNTAAAAVCALLASIDARAARATKNIATTRQKQIDKLREMLDAV